MGASDSFTSWWMSLSAFDSAALPEKYAQFPGFVGMFPLLNFILLVLEGKDLEIIQQHLSFVALNSATVDELFVSDGDRELAAISMISMMRELADLWIESGKSGDNLDVDTPSDRNIDYIPQGYPYSLSQLLSFGIFKDYPQKVGMKKDGKICYEERYPRFTSVEIEDLERGSACIYVGRKMAMYWFVVLLDSQFSHQISRCDSCNRFFSYERAPRRSTSAARLR
jgi:hypothetical protein